MQYITKHRYNIRSVVYNYLHLHENQIWTKVLSNQFATTTNSAHCAKTNK